jgi:hypothetical protein
MSPGSLTVFTIFISSVEAARRYSYGYWGLALIPPSARTFCLTNVTDNNIDADTCYFVVDCILTNTDEYGKLGLATGISLLSLIPPALSLIPTNGPGVEEAMSVGWVFALLAAVSGYIMPGKASGELAHELKVMPVTEFAAMTEMESKKTDGNSELVPLMGGPVRVVSVRSSHWYPRYSILPWCKVGLRGRGHMGL